MSGGYFDYAQSRIDDIADRIEDYLYGHELDESDVQDPFTTVSETTTSQPSMPSTTTTPCPTASVIASSRSRNSNVPSATCARRPSTPSAPTIC